MNAHGKPSKATLVTSGYSRNMICRKGGSTLSRSEVPDASSEVAPATMATTERLPCDASSLALLLDSLACLSFCLARKYRRPPTPSRMTAVRTSGAIIHARRRGT